jgi:hypothetical protein
MTRGLALYTHTHSIEYTAVCVSVCVLLISINSETQTSQTHTKESLVWYIWTFSKNLIQIFLPCVHYTHIIIIIRITYTLYSLSLEVVVIFFLFSFISLFSFGCERFWLSCFGCCVHGGLSRGEPQHFWLRGGNKRETHTRAVQVQNRRISEEGRKKEKAKEYI